MIPPTIGRIVHYNLNGNRRAAIVTAVHDHKTVDLEVFGERGDDRFKDKVVYGEEPADDVASARHSSMVNRAGCWCWPPRV